MIRVIKYFMTLMTVQQRACAEIQDPEPCMDVYSTMGLVRMSPDISLNPSLLGSPSLACWQTLLTSTVVRSRGGPNIHICIHKSEYSHIYFFKIRIRPPIFFEYRIFNYRPISTLLLYECSERKRELLWCVILNFLIIGPYPPNYSQQQIPY